MRMTERLIVIGGDAAGDERGFGSKAKAHRSGDRCLRARQLHLLLRLRDALLRRQGRGGRETTRRPQPGGFP